MTKTHFKTLTLTTALTCLAGAVSADDILTTSNGIVRTYLCVGSFCSDPETYSGTNDTLRLKQNNTRIHFEDTSVSAGFPTTDWRLQANDSNSGGDAYFAIRNETDGRVPFTISDGARTNAIFVDDNSRMGLGTMLPTQDIHIKTGDNPSVRLEQDGSGGFIPQTWDFAGNGTMFFVRDVSGGMTLPFIVRSGAPNNSFGINSDGNVGVGTSQAEFDFHVKGPGVQVAQIQSLNNAAQLQLRSTTQNRRILGMNGGNQVQTQIHLRNNEIRLLGSTDIGSDVFLIAGPNGISSQGPNCNPGPCDATFDPDEFEVPSIEDHAAYMWENQHLWAVGPTKPNEPINLTQKTGGILHELEVAHIYIEDLHERLKAQETEKTEMLDRISALEEALLDLTAD